MPKYFAALTFVILVGLVLTRVLFMKRKGVKAMNFGNLDKKDFLIPPLALFYFYCVFANAFQLPSVSRQVFFHSEAIAWVGVLICLAALGLFVASLVAFGESFRVGIDVDQPDRLVTGGVFGISRNPIYLAFVSVLLGQFLIFPNWILLVYGIAGVWLIHRQILREEDFLKEHYGQEFTAYSGRVHRYL